MNAWVINISEHQWWDPLTVWHLGASSLAFADGHAEKIKWADETVEFFKATKSFNSSGWRPTFSGGVEDLEWMLRGWAK
ncbi:MAG: hypothetical protein JEZ07_13980 [Phycisphaerae bacterium]|nr:hypothetical protein [Phycisphaerae bacterium]